MNSLSSVVTAGQRLGWNMEIFASCLRTTSEDGNEKTYRQNVNNIDDVIFIKDDGVDEYVDDEDEMELR
jgi:hypothetical protein